MCVCVCVCVCVCLCVRACVMWFKKVLMLTMNAMMDSNVHNANYNVLYMAKKYCMLFHVIKR